VRTSPNATGAEVAPARRRRGLLLALALLAACNDEAPAQSRVVGGDAERGQALIASHGCAGCHAIPGIAPSVGTVGPPLAGFARRGYIAGRLPNRPMMLTAWLRDPPAIDPATAMPNLGLSEAEALDVAAYLYTLR
jgi:mono/diheme cytochrome c family protein